MKSVLIVDDDRNIRKLLDFSLQKAGFSVMMAEDGDRGMALATANSPDVAVLDVMMPGMHGYELCRRLRANAKTARTKIIFLTARSQPIDEQEALKAGADLFLSKPVIPEELVGHIQSLLVESDEEVSVPPEPEPEPVEEKEVEATPRGRLVVCFSPSSGAGVTTLSVNLALAFAAWQHLQMPLVELHAVQGAMLPALGLEAEPLRGNLRATGKELSWDTLVLHLVEHPSGVRALPAPPEGVDVPPVLAAQAVSLLRERFPLVVVDAEHALNERTVSVLRTADLILLLTTPDVPSIRAMLKALQSLRVLKFPERQVLLVVNNVHPRPSVPIEKLQEGITRPIFTVIPHEPAMAGALRTGNPVLVTQPRSPASQAIGRMTLQLARGMRLSKAT